MTAFNLRTKKWYALQTGMPQLICEEHAYLHLPLARTQRTQCGQREWAVPEAGSIGLSVQCVCSQHSETQGGENVDQ